jgi:succinylglutamate desuccinylase
MVLSMGKRKSIPHDIGPDVSVLQFASDGNESLYQVQVNMVPDAELHVKLIGQIAIVDFKQNNGPEESLQLSMMHANWISQAHADIEVMLQRYYPGANFNWFTKR